MNPPRPRSWTYTPEGSTATFDRAELEQFLEQSGATSFPVYKDGKYFATAHMSLAEFREMAAKVSDSVPK